jgi:hypothetical protein
MAKVVLRPTSVAKQAACSGNLGASWLDLATAGRVFTAKLLVTTLACFIALEVLYQLSNKNNGLADVDTAAYARYALLLLPVITMSICPDSTHKFRNLICFGCIFLRLK